MSNSQKVDLQKPQMVQNAYFNGVFCYYSNDISEINTRLLYLGYSSNKPIISKLSVGTKLAPYFKYSY